MVRKLLFSLAVAWLSSNVVAQTNINSAEYFFDVDPGEGNATAVPAFVAGSSVDLTFDVDVSGLSQGMHVLGIRVKDVTNTWSIPAFSIVYVSGNDPLTDEAVNAAEYFFDTDPGPGLASPVPGIVSAPDIDHTFAASTATLAYGMHMMGIRTRNSAGEWTLPAMHMVYVSANDPTVDENITAAEYFFDVDPGEGGATAVPGMTAAGDIDHTFDAATSALAEGMHMMGIRTQNARGGWSVPATHMVYVSGNDPTTNEQITGGEFFFDNDPGAGSGTPIGGIVPGTSIDHTFSASTSSLPAGMHVMGVRTENAVGEWSVPLYKLVYVFGNDPMIDEEITAAEYFFDLDPGAGGATPVPAFTSDHDVDVSFLANTSSLTTGMHVLGIRTQNSRGLWSATSTTTLYVQQDRSISRVEYYFDSDPGLGNGTVVDIDPPMSAIDMDVIVSTLALQVGAHTLGMRAGRVDETWSETSTAAFSVCSYATPSFSTGTVCAGQPVTFTDESTGTLPGDTYAWDFDEDGVTDDNTAGGTSYAYSGPGTYTVALTIDRSGCSASFSSTVTVVSAPAPNAGADQDLCVNDALLAGSVPGTGEEGLWTLVSGTATITDPTDPGTTVTSIISYNTVLEWTVTNTVGGCSGSDQMAIVSNQPITTGLVSASLAIGESVNRDVQNTAVANPGDVLTTTIVTGPTKGTAEIGSNGSITYTAAEGTVGADVVVYEVCNQCGHCAANNFEVEIINNPPVITQPPAVVVQPGEAVSLELLGIISDANNNLDLSSLTVVQQPISGATASIDGSYRLIIDYTGVFFSGVDQLTIRACDLSGACADNVILIEVDLPADPPVFVYNALSPNGDGRHDFLELENIEAYPDNHVYIVNRWGVRVYEASGYNNSSVRFEGTGNSGGAKDLPAGTYYYSVDLGKGGDRVTGFLVLK